jgi:hypothetical protein
MVHVESGEGSGAGTDGGYSPVKTFANILISFVGAGTLSPLCVPCGWLEVEVSLTSPEYYGWLV